MPRDPPIQLARRYADGTRQTLYPAPANPASAAWREGQQRRAEQDHAEALRWWQHIRTLADRQQQDTS
ncbi:hypothetical protein WIS52_19250 [Pseudonocardia nematodicida]|uniref:Uncharacterized protein n=1 Tax=Pseudonocardia nematodicida TaxID=1206997 RepID=A0ABV1KDR9_9PSEU